MLVIAAGSFLATYHRYISTWRIVHPATARMPLFADLVAVLTALPSAIRADPTSCAASISLPDLQSTYLFDADDHTFFQVNVTYGDCAGQEIESLINTNRETARCTA